MPITPGDRKDVFVLSVATGDGGAERSMEILISHIQDHFRLTIFACRREHIERLRVLLRPPSRLVVMPSFRHRGCYKLSYLLLALHALLRRPRVVVANTNLSAFIAAAVRLRAPHFIYIRDFLWGELPLIFGKLPDAHVLLPSPAPLQRDGYLTPYLGPRGTHRYSVLPDMVDMPQAAEAPEGGYVLHLATVNWFKGHHHLIAIAAALRDQEQPMRFISRGLQDDKRLTEALRNEIARRDLGGIFEMQPYCSDTDDVLRGCLCVVVTTVSSNGGPETFGRTVIEAWAHRKPVVAFAVGGPAHLIEHEVDGILIPEGDNAAFAAALLRLRDDPVLCRRLGENGYRKVCERYEAAVVARRFASLLTEAGAA